MFTLGVVSYLNALPLYHTLQRSGEIQIVRAVPSQLSAMLEAGECDAALMPVVDWFRQPAWQIVSDACIACDGAVQSVLLFSKVHAVRINSIALDTSSHTSVALLKVLCAQRIEIAPQFIDCAPELDAMLEVCDAALLIGDPALRIYLERPARGLHRYDLGREWQILTGHSFVFAAWIARSDINGERLKVLTTLLESARDTGVRQIPRIAQQMADDELSSADITHYLSGVIRHSLTPPRVSGLNAFRDNCVALGLVPPNAPRP